VPTIALNVRVEWLPLVKLWRTILCWLSMSAALFGPALALTAQRAVEPSHSWPTDGIYPADKGVVYVGLTGEPPNNPWLQYFEPSTRRTGALVHLQGSEYRSAEQPYLRFDLQKPVIKVIEDRHLIRGARGNFGFSVWHIPGATSKPLIVLIEGWDDATRDMGFLIPYFVGHGMTVLTYDQRGTGVSSGNWLFTSPESKAADVVAALRSLAGDQTIDFHRIGVWAVSYGGWVAPVVAQRYPLAFMILKSADSGSVADNTLYGVRQDLERDHRFSAQQVAAALTLERRMLNCLAINSPCQITDEELRWAKKQPWFSLTRIPPDARIPLPEPVLAGYRASLIYDPTPVLEQTTVPTLALFGSLDRNVDAGASERGFRADFAKSGMKDVTFRMFPGADHHLEQSRTGYDGDEIQPVRYASGYPEIMIQWLRKQRVLR
jgi:pimeloyl-ACP methyl ester carboxylesterase